ncbi:hypothetical protein LRS13_05415 [Svornostia abyssi]|uniref:Galactose oxidase n=1 Tax=Svornostia abyssi TaxID=2898438 RepID=A0ABY5PK30_9ACTN|nr:hypothetical protein LRS13_05415 [Parviterribacteraceae bacterium J379]
MLTRWLSLAAVSLVAVLAAAVPAQADPGQTGRWSAVQNYPVVPISAAVTPDGKIVAWDQADPGTPHSISPNNGKAMILDPETGTITRSANIAPASVFCPLITTLPDGKVAITGGGNDTVNSDLVQIYDPESKTFGTWSTLSTGRWYGGGSISKNGDIVALGGRGGSGADVVDAETGRNRRAERQLRRRLVPARAADAGRPLHDRERHGSAHQQHADPPDPRHHRQRHADRRRRPHSAAAPGCA